MQLIGKTAFCYHKLEHDIDNYLISTITFCYHFGYHRNRGSILLFTQHIWQCKIQFTLLPVHLKVLNCTIDNHHQLNCITFYIVVTHCCPKVTEKKFQQKYINNKSKVTITTSIYYISLKDQNFVNAINN